MENFIKYPRTYHFVFSKGTTSDDKFQNDLSMLIGKRGILSYKMDGENTTVYNNHFHARSVDSNNHPSRNFVKGYWAERQHLIPNGWRVCGENLYAQHSINYEELGSYFYCFNMWDENNNCLSYDETLEWCELLNIKHVDVIFDGVFDYDFLNKIYTELDFNKIEGIVFRLADTFHYGDFEKCVIKGVRPNHVQTDKHWSAGPIVPNKLK